MRTNTYAYSLYITISEVIKYSSAERPNSLEMLHHQLQEQRELGQVLQDARNPMPTKYLEIL